VGKLQAKVARKATMSENEQDENKHFGLTQAEYDNLKDMVRYGLIIVTTVAITFVIVALVSKMVGY
jgi:hypothetical protein